MSIIININDGQVAAVTPSQATATSGTADQSAGAGPNALLEESTTSVPVHSHAEARDAGGPSAALIQEVESALGQLADIDTAAANEDRINAGAAPASV
jgi:hypothetical protein